MGKSNKELIVQNETQIDESQIFEHVASIIESRKSSAGAYANREVTLMYWEAGHYISSVVLGGSRAAYGKQIVSTLSTQLSWSHFVEVLPQKTAEARMYYVNEAAQRNFGIADLRAEIARKAYENS